jgi:Ser/Thr protein kinase RdoA (MazF antagonist)
MERMSSASLLERVEERYGLTGIRGIRLLEGGERNRVLRTECEQGAFVLRISPPDTAAEGIGYEHALMRTMHGYLPQVPRPVAGHDGSTWLLHENRIVTVFPLMAGRMADRECAWLRLEAARVLARIHWIALRHPDRSSRPGYPPLRDLDWDENHIWSWSAVSTLLAAGSGGLQRAAAAELPEGAADLTREIAERRPQIEAEGRGMERWVARLVASGRPLHFAPIHGDYYSRNLLVEGERVTAVLDWDDCQSEWLVLELGRAVWEFCKCKRRHTLQLPRARAFLRAYQEAGGPVPQRELDLLVPFMRYTRLMEVLSDLTRAARGQGWDAEDTLHNLLSLENLLNVPSPLMTSSVSSGGTTGE